MQACEIFRHFLLVFRHFYLDNLITFSLIIVTQYNHLTEKSIPENAFRELSGTRKLSGENDATFLGSEMFACFEKHQKSFSGALGPKSFREFRETHARSPPSF